jgi:hypothetical protein
MAAMLFVLHVKTDLLSPMQVPQAVSRVRHIQMRMTRKQPVSVNQAMQRNIPITKNKIIMSLLVSPVQKEQSAISQVLYGT